MVGIVVPQPVAVPVLLLLLVVGQTPAGVAVLVPVARQVPVSVVVDVPGSTAVPVAQGSALLCLVAGLFFLAIAR